MVTGRPEEHREEEKPAEPRSARRAGIARGVWSRLRARPIRNSIILGLVATSIVALGLTVNALAPLTGRVSSERAASSDKAHKPAQGKVHSGPTPQDALAAFDRGQHEQARNLAVDLRKADGGEKSRGAAAMVLGLVLAHEADEQSNDRERRTLYLVASRYLQESKAAGWPRGREAVGQWQLGRCLYECSRYAEAIPELEMALKIHPEQRTEICRRLAIACLRIPDPRKQDSLKYGRQVLADKKLSAKDRENAILLQARILLEQPAIEECRQVIREIPANSPNYPEAALLGAQLSLCEGELLEAEAAGDAQKQAAAQQRFQAARKDLEEMQKHAELGVAQDRKVNLLLGIACRRSGDDAAALAAVSKVSRSGFETPEGLLAGLEEAELQIRLDRSDEALESYRRMVRQIGDVQLYNNPWISLPELRTRIERTYATWRKAGHFDMAMELAQALSGVLGDERSIQLHAEAQEEWAKRLEQTAAEGKPEDYDALAADARSAWRKAGEVRRDLARLKFSTREYPEYLWLAAEDFRRGHAYPQAVDLLKKYIEQAERTKSPPALTALGQSLLALNQPEAALAPLNECMTYHATDPACYRARLVAADACVELGKWEEAKQLLVRNLEQESLTPRSIEWRESLDRLGHILYEQGLEHETKSRLNGVNSSDPETRKKGLKDLELAFASFQEAIRRLSEFVDRVEPKTPTDTAEKTQLSRYLLAEAHRRSALLPRKKMLGVTIDTLRGTMNRQMQLELESAIEGYTDLQTRLNDKQDTGRLTPLEERLLRNCYFAQAASLADLGRYEEAIRAYQTATTRYQREPESLQAYVQIANCLRRLGRRPEAQSTLDQAKVVLRQIAPEADFLATTCYPREQWAQMLDWMGSL